MIEMQSEAICTSLASEDKSPDEVPRLIKGLTSPARQSKHSIRPFLSERTAHSPSTDHPHRDDNVAHFLTPSSLHATHNFALRVTLILLSLA